MRPHGIMVINERIPLRADVDWATLGIYPNWSRANPAIKPAKAYDSLSPKTKKPYKNPSRRIPVFHSEYSTVSGTMAHGKRK